jgi:peptide/nickel transport system permease protein
VTIATALGFYAMPTHWLALMLVIIFAGVFPSGGMVDDFLIDPTWFQHVKDVLYHMTLPASTLALVLYGEYTLIVRSAMLETLGEDYILTARAKGLKPRAIVRKHALRNALLPITTLIAISLGYIVAGSILVETVFSWPGIGRAVYQAVLQRDYPMLQGAFLVLVLSVVFFNLVADLLYFKLDPRIAE